MNIHELPDDPGSSAVLVVVKINNIGPPTSLEAYVLQIEFLSGTLVKGEQRLLPDRLNLSGDAGDQTFYGADALYNRTVQPVQTGAMVTGALWFQFRGVPPSSFTPDTTLHLAFKDVNVAEHNAVRKVPALTGRPTYFPGMERR